MTTDRHPEDYTENQNRHDFGANDPYGKNSDFDAEHDFANASEQTTNPSNKQPYTMSDQLPGESSNTRENGDPAGPLDEDDKSDSRTDDEPADADPNKTKPYQERTGSDTSKR